jgi:hypothetical protein
MSTASASFQKLVTGVEAGSSFVRNGVKFDGIDLATGTLLDAKGPGFANFVNGATGKFYDWFRGSDTLVQQAQRQLDAADGAQVRWVFANQSARDATADVLSRNGVEGIDLVVKSSEP